MNKENCALKLVDEIIWQYCLLVTARSLYMFWMLPASIIRSAPVAVTTVFSTPDDGRRKRPKHVE